MISLQKDRSHKLDYQDADRSQTNAFNYYGHIKLLSPLKELQTKTQERKTTPSPEISYLCQLSQSQARVSQPQACAEHKPTHTLTITNSLREMIPKALKIILQKKKQLRQEDNLLSSSY